MKSIIWFTTGLLLPSLLAVCLLASSHVLNDWSGISPLNYLYWIPLFYLMHLSVTVAYFTVTRRRAKNLKYVFLAGVVGGLSLTLLPKQTAFFRPGNTNDVDGGHCMTWILWLSTKAPDDLGVALSLGF